MFLGEPITFIKINLVFFLIVNFDSLDHRSLDRRSEFEFPFFLSFKQVFAENSLRCTPAVSANHSFSIADPQEVRSYSRERQKEEEEER